MSDLIGPLTFGKKEEHIFLGREIQQHQDYSEATAVIIDEEVRSLLEKADRVAHDILETNIDKLKALAEMLLEKEIVDSRQVDEVIGRSSGDAEPVAEPTPNPTPEV